MIIFGDDSDKIRWPDEDRHDPDSEKYYFINYYPSARSNLTSYTKNLDVIVPSTPNGCMYICKSGGISATTEPSMPTQEGGTVEDGDVLWKCQPLTTLLGPGDTITSSIWIGDTGVVTTLPLITGGIVTEVKVTAVPNQPLFTLTNEIEILYASGKIEKRQKSLVIKIREL